MERAREKLHSSTGASMLIALLFFLVAMAVGAVVLTAASANAGRAERNRQAQQNYLAVASAAELAKEDIAGASFTGGYQKIVEVTVTTEEYTDPITHEVTTRTITTSSTNHVAEKPKTEGSQLLSEELTALLNAIYLTTVPAETKLQTSWDRTTDTTRDLSFTASGMPAVAGHLAVSPADDRSTGRRQYALTVVLSVEPEQEDDPSLYVTTLEFAPSVTEQVKADPPVVDGNTTIYTTHYTTTVTWQAPVITKGEES